MLKPRIYTVATAHLDTSWNWDLETTIREYLPRTIYDNLALFEKYPEYVFSFEGSYRYELMEEYDPEGFARVKEAVAQGRWRVAGSAYENGDVNIPSPEALIRNILYGNNYFDKTFGKRSRDIYLPDCFGFGWALPSIAAHCKLLGFTTQKVCWSCAYGVPFDLGVWRGPDGERIYASLDARNYAATLKRVRRHSVHLKLNENIKKYDLPFTFVLHGVGDRGGAPKEESVQTVLGELRQNENQKVDVLCAGSDDVFRDLAALPPELQQKLPQWETELVMTDHGVGGYTSRAIGKRWNRKGEQLAAAAEQLACASSLLGARSYPQNVLDTAWKRIIAHQFHDDIPGTSLVKCYQRNWNDYMLSMNQLGEEIRFSAACLAQGMDSAFAKGRALTVTNTLQFARRETVSACVPVSADCRFIRVFDASGAEVPSQLNNLADGTAEIAFCASLPGFACALFDVREYDSPCTLETGLSVTEQTLENERYLVTLDENGDIASIYDKQSCVELLDAPVRMALQDYDGYPNYPAWELDYNEAMAPPREYAARPMISVLENGAARAALRVIRSCPAQDGETSFFAQTISLDAGGEFLRVENEIEWRSLRSLLKTEFPFTVKSEEATYDLGLGTIRRGSSHTRLYEVPAQMWADISEPSAFYGVSVLSDSKIGWDKPNENTLRLTGIHSPRAAYSDQHLMEFGLNRYGFGIYGHCGSWTNGTQKQAACFNAPLQVFLVPPSAGPLGSEYCFARCSEEKALIRALKKAQDSDELIVRFNEGAGDSLEAVQFSLCGPCRITAAREVSGSEEPVSAAGKYTLKDGVLQFDMTACQLRSFALTVESNLDLGGYDYAAWDLPYDTDAVSSNSARTDGALPNGYAIPAEQFPAKIVSAGIPFTMGSAAHGENNTVTCRGQRIPLPEGVQTLHLIAASCRGDMLETLRIGNAAVPFAVQDCEEAIGAWDLYSLGETGYVKTDALAWNSTHAHKNGEDDPAKQLYFFHYRFNVTNAADFTLPENENLVILAATLTRGEPLAVCAAPLYDQLEKRPCTYQISPEADAEAHRRGKEHQRGRYKFLRNYISRRLAAELNRYKRVKR